MFSFEMLNINMLIWKKMPQFDKFLVDRTTAKQNDKRK